MTFLHNPLHLLNEETLIRSGDLGTLAFRQVDVVCLDVGIRKPIGQHWIHRGSVQLRWTQKGVHGIVDGIALDSDFRTTSLGILDIQDREQLLHGTQAKLDLDFAILQSNQGQRSTNVFTEPKMKGHHNLATADGGLGLRGCLEDLHRMRLLEHAPVGIPGIIDLRNIAHHLIDQGTLIGIMGHLGLQLEPLAVGSVHSNSVDVDRGTLDGVVSNVFNPLELKTGVIQRGRCVGILQGRPDVREIEHKVAVVQKVRDTTDLATKCGGSSRQRKLKACIVEIQSHGFHREIGLTLLHRSEERHRGVSVQELVLSSRCHELEQTAWHSCVSCE